MLCPLGAVWPPRVSYWFSPETPAGDGNHLIPPLLPLPSLTCIMINELWSHHQQPSYCRHSNQCVLIVLPSLVALAFFFSTIHVCWSVAPACDSPFHINAQKCEKRSARYYGVFVQRHIAAALWWRWYGRSNIDAVPTPPWLCADPPLPIPLR